MNQYIAIHRLTGPAILLLLGIVALLSEEHVVSFGIFVPLLLILLGVLKLAERMTWSGWGYPPQGMGPQPPGMGPQAPGMGQQQPGATAYGSNWNPGSGPLSVVPPRESGSGGSGMGGDGR